MHVWQPFFVASGTRLPRRKLAATWSTFVGELPDQVEPKCGWEEIVLAMRRYSKNVIIQTKGCFFLGCVAQGHSHDQKMVDAGAHGVIIQSMRNFPEHAQLQHAASIGLAQIANSTDEIKRQLCGCRCT